MQPVPYGGQLCQETAEKPSLLSAAALKMHPALVMDAQQLAYLRRVPSPLVEKSNRLRLELEDRLASLDKVRIAMRRLERSLKHVQRN